MVHTYSGHEDRVQQNLEQRIKTMDLKDKIFEVVVPKEEEDQIKPTPPASRRDGCPAPRRRRVRSFDCSSASRCRARLPGRWGRTSSSRA